MDTANAFGLFLLAPITDVLSHWCLGATPGVFITFGNVKIDFASASVGFGPPEPAKMVVLFMSNSIILGAMYLFFLMVLFIVVCISDLVLVCLCMQNWWYSVGYASKNGCLWMLSTMNCGVL